MLSLHERRLPSAKYFMSTANYCIVTMVVIGTEVSALQRHVESRAKSELGLTRGL